MGQPELESHHALPHPRLPRLLLISSCPKAGTLVCTGSVPSPWFIPGGQSQPKASLRACCGAAGSPARGAAGVRGYGEGAGAGSGEGRLEGEVIGEVLLKEMFHGECSETPDPRVPEAPFPSPHTSWRLVNVHLLIHNLHFPFGSTNSSRKPGSESSRKSQSVLRSSSDVKKLKGEA